MENITQVENITKMGVEKQNQKLREFIKVDTVTKLKILAYQKKLFHKLKSIHIDLDNEILTLSSLILATDEILNEFDSININAIKLRGKNNKVKVKRQKLLGYWAIVRTLKCKEQMSFRDISEYFAKYHRFQVAHSTIYNLWNELENNNKEKIK